MKKTILPLVLAGLLASPSVAFADTGGSEQPSYEDGGYSDFYYDGQWSADVSDETQWDGVEHAHIGAGDWSAQPGDEVEVPLPGPVNDRVEVSQDGMTFWSDGSSIGARVDSVPENTTGYDNWSCQSSGNANFWWDGGAGSGQVDYVTQSCRGWNNPVAPDPEPEPGAPSDEDLQPSPAPEAGDPTQEPTDNPTDTTTTDTQEAPDDTMQAGPDPETSLEPGAEERAPALAQDPEPVQVSPQTELTIQPDPATPEADPAPAVDEPPAAVEADTVVPATSAPQPVSHPTLPATGVDAPAATALVTVLLLSGATAWLARRDDDLD